MVKVLGASPGGRGVRSGAGSGSRRSAAAGWTRCAALSAGLERMAEDIRLERTPLPRLLERLGREDGAGAAAAVFFRGLARALAAGSGAGDAPGWRRRRPCPCAGRTGRPWRRPPGLSRETRRQVCRALTAASARLRRSLEAARTAGPEREKRAAALWLSGAALLVILLI